MLHMSKSVYSNDPINSNHRQILLIGTDHFNSKLFSLRKNNHSVSYYSRKSAGGP